MLKYSISKPLFFVVCFLSTLFASGQTESSSDAPSICDCKANSYKDSLLLERCELAYNYNEMTSAQRYNFEQKLKACDDPSPCDCETRAKDDAYLKATCEEVFDTTKMSEKELDLYLKEIKACTVIPDKPSLKEICECVNADDDEQKGYCKDIWNLTKLSKDDRLLFIEEMQACKEHKDDPDFTLSICDCLDARDDDYELKERCITKFNINELSAVDIEKLRADSKNCNIMRSGGDEFDQICSCLKEEQANGEMSGKCIEFLASLEDKYTSMPPDELQAFYERLLECMGISSR